MKYIISTLILYLVFLECRSQDLVPFRVDTLWGYKDKQGTVKIEPQFQYAKKFMANVGIVAKNDMLGAIDKNNNQIIPFRYEFLRPLDSAEFLFGKRAIYYGEYIMGVMTRDEQVKIPAEYSSIIKYRNTYWVTKDKDSVVGKIGSYDNRSVRTSHGLYDSGGKTILPCKYGYISWATDSVLVVRESMNGNQALFTTQGKQLTGFDYMVFGKFITGIAKARIGDKFGFIFPTGKIALPIQYDYCDDVKNGYAMIKQGDKWGAVNAKGKIIIKPTKEPQKVINELKEKYGWEDISTGP